MPKDTISGSPCAAFVNQNSDAFIKSARLLGGPESERRAIRLINDLSFGQPIAAKQNRELNALEDLLSLRHVDNPDRDETAYFIAIDPVSPQVDMICCLLDRLQAA